MKYLATLMFAMGLFVGPAAAQGFNFDLGPLGGFHVGPGADAWHGGPHWQGGGHDVWRGGPHWRNSPWDRGFNRGFGPWRHRFGANPWTPGPDDPWLDWRGRCKRFNPNWPYGWVWIC